MLDRLNPQDAQILRLEAGAVRGHTCKLVVLDPSGGRPLPTAAALREHVSARLDAAPRLRRRLVPTPLRLARPAWIDDPEFDIARHVTRVPGAGPVGGARLEELVARVMTERLDRAHPLWRLDVVEQLEDGGCALIWRVHHCLADGGTNVRLGAAVLWDDDPDPPSPPPSSWRAAPLPGAFALAAHGLADRARGRARPDRGRAGPSLLASRAVIGRELARTASVSGLAARAGPGRRVGRVTVPLDAARRAGKAIDEAATLNDVVLAIVAGGVRTWLERGARPRTGVRVKVPVSLHDSTEGVGAGNRDSYFFVDLPVAEADPAGRLVAISRQTSHRKRARDAEALYRLGRHRPIARWAMSPRVFTFGVSNVHGPPHDVFVLGARVRELYSIAEIAQRHTLRIAVISAAGQLHFGLCADRDAVPDLQVLADGLRRASDELLERVS